MNYYSACCRLSENHAASDPGMSHASFCSIDAFRHYSNNLRQPTLFNMMMPILFNIMMPASLGCKHIGSAPETAEVRQRLRCAPLTHTSWYVHLNVLMCVSSIYGSMHAIVHVWCLCSGLPAADDFLPVIPLSELCANSIFPTLFHTRCSCHLLHSLTMYYPKYIIFMLGQFLVLMLRQVLIHVICFDRCSSMSSCGPSA